MTFFLASSTLFPWNLSVQIMRVFRILFYQRFWLFLQGEVARSPVDNEFIGNGKSVCDDESDHKPYGAALFYSTGLLANQRVPTRIPATEPSSSPTLALFLRFY